MYDPLLLPELRLMLIENDEQAMKEFCEVMHPGKAAENLEGLSDVELWRILSHTDTSRQAEIFSFIELSRQVNLIQAIDQHRMASLLDKMAPDDRAKLLLELGPEQRESLLPLVAQAQRDELRKMLSYPEHSAGSIMTTDYASLPANISVKAALNQLRLQAPNSETIYYVYVLDEQRHLKGFVTLRQLIMARPDTQILEIMEQDMISVRVDEDQEVVANKLGRYDFIAIPVVDEQDRLVGIITHDDVLDVLQEEATEDVHRMGGVGPMEENYLQAPFFTVWYKRSFWLACLFGAELFTFSALVFFQAEIEKIAVLSLFLPLCISTGGNSGSQAATLICRALALGQVSLKQWLVVLRHELAMGVALGLTLGAIGFVRAALTPHSVLKETSRWELALVISQSAALICLWGTLVGSMLPLIFKRIGVDPGIASSPFVATFVDVTGIIIYFTTAKIYLL